MNNKLITLCLILTLFLSFNAFSGTYNSTYSNLTLDQNGWCANLAIPFKIYNGSEFPLHKDEDPEFNFTLIASPKIKIYDGPLQSSKILLDSTASANGEFNYTFTVADDYLIEITPTGNFNSYSELIAVDECKYIGQKTVVTNPNTLTTQVKLYNKNFTYNNETTIYLSDTNMLYSTNLTVKNINGITQNGLTNLDNVIKSFNFQGVSKNYSNIEIEITLNSIDPQKITKGYYYENNVWIERNIILTENKIKFTNVNYGIYAITSENNPDPITPPTPEIPLTTLNETTNPTTPLTETTTEDQTTASTTEEITENIIEEVSIDETSSESNSNTIYYALGGILLIGLIIGGYKLLPKKAENKPHVDMINSYNEIYGHAKKYVQTYKNEYSKDQIYRALEAVNVPRDIIDKIILEEFQ